MREPKEVKDKEGVRKRFIIRGKKWWSTYHDARKMEKEGYKGFTKDPEEDNGFYGHVLPSDFKRTNIIRSYGKA